MANSLQAKKRARQAEKRRAHNASRRSAGRTAVKKVVAAIRAGDQEAARAAYRDAVSLLDRIANKKIIHRNKVSRYKRRLHAHIRGMEGDAPAAAAKEAAAAS